MTGPSATNALNQTWEAALQHHSAGRFPEAERLYREILKQAPDHGQSHLHLGIIALQTGQPEEAARILARAVAIKPDMAELHACRADALKSLGRYPDAEGSYRRALDLNPQLLPAHGGLGEVYLALSRWSESEACFRNALGLNSQAADLHNNLGVSLEKQGRLGEAEVSFRDALDRDPGLAAAWANLCPVLMNQGRLAEAEAGGRRALALGPESPEAHHALGNILVAGGRIREGEACYRRALELRPDYAVARSNLLLALQYDPGEEGEEALFRERLAWQSHCGHNQGPAPSYVPSDPEGRLRIGYVSADFHRHSVSFFLEGIFQAHDRAGFEIVAYANAAIEDDVTQRLRGMTDGWRSILGLGDAEAAELIRKDRIDILVDLSGHTARNRLPLFSLKPAPVQVTWLGYPDATGLAAMDYRFTDPICDPPPPQSEAEGGAGPRPTESLIRLPHGFLRYQPPDEAPEVLPAEWKKDPVTFASFNNLSKLSAETITAWAEILTAVPGARLLLKDKGFACPETRHRMTGSFEARGISSDRLTLLSRDSSFREHLARYNQVHVALDPFPYNGTTTTCEALWMGAPVVTLRGERHAGRVGASLLTRLGLESLIGDSLASYREIAVELAHDREKRHTLAHGLRERMAASPLGGGERIARDVEGAYRMMWRSWHACLEA